MQSNSTAENNFWENLLFSGSGIWNLGGGGQARLEDRIRAGRK